MNLHQGDFITALSVSEAINDIFGDNVAVPLDASSIKVRSPKDPSQKVAFVSLLENIEVEPSRPAAKVVVNARTGTIVIGGDVRVTPAAVTHGSLTVKIDEKESNGNRWSIVNENQVVTTPGDAVITPETDIEVEEEPAKAFVFDPGVSLSTIVDTINAVGAGASDLVAILEALRVWCTESRADNHLGLTMEIKSPDYQTDTGFTLFQKNKSKANLEALAEEFESMFVNQMLKQARESKLSDGLFSSNEEDNFGTMLDQERARSLALNLDLGIADALLRQFGKNSNR